MRILLLGGLWLMTASGAAAFTSLKVEPIAPYEPYLVTAPYDVKRVFLGELEGFPDTYEVAQTEAFTLTLHLQTLLGQPVDPALAIIIVEVNEAGTGEVARLPYVADEWQPARQAATGLKLLAGPQYEADLPAGMYRIEISTPNNIGQYLLTIGSESTNSGYISTLRHIARVYDFADQSRWGMVYSPYVQIPLAMLVVAFLLGATWRWRNYIRA